MFLSLRTAVFLVNEAAAPHMAAGKSRTGRLHTQIRSGLSVNGAAIFPSRAVEPELQRQTTSQGQHTFGTISMRGDSICSR